MDFGTILKNDCVNQPLPPDTRCDDPAFRFANPSLCPIVPTLILKPGNALVCLLGSIQFRAFYVSNGVETDVTDKTIFTVNDPTVLVIGASSGNSTGISEGDVVVSATYNDLTATASLTVLGSGNCCEQQSVSFLVMIDTSLSMSQAFGGAYTTKLEFAKFAAKEFISQIDTTKDKVGLMSFNDFDFTIIDAPTSDKASVSNHVTAITQTQQSTSFFNSLQAAVNSLNATGAERLVIVLISDGQDESQALYATQNPVSVAQLFKQVGGFVICLGTRATGTGYGLLNAICTGGFFVNSYPGIEADALTLFDGLKGYTCGGNCVPEGDNFVATGELNYTGWANWTGQADLLGNGFIDLLPGNGLYVDLSSANAPFEATLTSQASFAVAANKTYSLTLFLAANQRVNIPSNVTITVKSASVVYLNQTLSISPYFAGFAQSSFSFTPQVDDAVQIIITGSGATNLNVAGPLLDKIVFENVTDLVNILTDDFDNENVQYVPPRCGASTYGSAYGYNCYTTGCLDSDPPPSQLQDPHALPDIEGGFTPPQLFKGTKTACVTCPPGFSNVPNGMISGDASTSTITASSSSRSDLPTLTGSWESNQTLPQWVQWKFTAPAIVTLYSVANAVGDIYQGNPFKAPSPADWSFQGSNDGMTWTTLDTQSGIFWPTTALVKQFSANNATAYSYYRILITAADGPLFPFGGSDGNIYVQTQALSLFGQISQQACATESATSSVSQSDADAQALAAATVSATALLNCQKQYTSTQSYTAHCPAGALGSPVTKTANATSFISQADADAQALATATATAQSALVCDGDNHNQAIQIADDQAAIPYPSVKRVTGLTGLITNITVTVKNFSHQAPSDVQIVLQSPAGTYVQLMNNCGGPLGSNPVTDLTFIFDDAGATLLPQNGVLVSGTFKPSQYGAVSDLQPPAAAHPYQTTLASLIGEDPNGSWALWVVDKLPISAGSIAGVPAFDVTITSA